VVASHDQAPGMAPVKIIAAHELVLEQIRTAIMLGRYRPGDCLPPERALAEFLNVSRTTVRGAIAILADEGIIEIKRGRGGGLFVKETVATDAQTRRALRKNREQIRQVFEFRVTVESACARLAAERRTHASLKEMHRLLRAMNALKGPNGEVPSRPAESAQFHSLDTDFHLAIAKASRNPWLQSAVLDGRVEMFRPVGSLLNALDVSSDYLHDRIVQAIEDREADKAGQYMAEHIGTTELVVESWLD
jgi:GntR family transcriptional regulator, transcriptional repressor for pyruvate dehydrogenase complex